MLERNANNLKFKSNSENVLFLSEKLSYSFKSDFYKSIFTEKRFLKINKLFKSSNETLASKIQAQYESAISRTSNYKGDLKNHILNQNCFVKEVLENNYICGQVFENSIFQVSHFAPANIFSGYKLIKSLLTSNTPCLLAVLDLQANMLKKAGYTYVTDCKQMFAGEIHTKHIYINNACLKFIEKIKQAVIDNCF